MFHVASGHGHPASQLPIRSASSLPPLRSGRKLSGGRKRRIWRRRESASNPAACSRLAKRTAGVLLLSPGRFGMLGASSMPSIRPRPRTVWMTLGYCWRQLLQAVLEESAGLPRVVGQLLALDDLENLQRDRAGQRRAAESRAVRARRRANRRKARAPKKRRWGSRRPSDLAIEMPSGRNCLAAGHAFEDALEALEPAGAEVPALHAVHEQQQLLLVAQPAQAQQVFRRWRASRRLRPGCLRSGWRPSRAKWPARMAARSL